MNPRTPRRTPEQRVAAKNRRRETEVARRAAREKKRAAWRQRMLRDA